MNQPATRMPSINMSSMNTHTPQRQILIWGLLVATICWLGVMSFASRQFEKSECPAGGWIASAECALDSPGVDLQLTTLPEGFQEILVPGSAAEKNIKIMRTNTYLDFGLIILYWSLFFLLAGACPGRIGRFARVVISVAALFDIFENNRLLHAFGSLDATGIVRTPLPRPLSLTKWAAFAVALFLLGDVIRKHTKTGVAQVVAWSLITSSACVIIGLLLGSPLITVALAILVFPLLAALVYYAPFQIPVETIFIVIEYIYLMRFQIVAGLLLGVVLPAAYWLVPSIFVGFFDARAFWSLVFVAWSAVQLAWCVMVTSRLVLVYGPDRFDLNKTINVNEVGTKTVIAFGSLAIPVLAVAYKGTLDMGAMEKGLSISIGIVLAVAQLFVTAAVHFRIEGPEGHTAAKVFPSFGRLKRTTTQPSQRTPEEQGTSKRPRRIATWISTWPEYISAGLIRKSDGSIRSG